MSKGHDIELAALLFSLALIACIAVVGVLHGKAAQAGDENPDREEYRTEINSELADTLRRYIAVMDLADEGRDTRRFLYGYAYHLLSMYSSESGIDCRIEISRDHRDPIEELRDGKIDILVVPMGKLPDADGVLVSIPVDSCCLWLMKEGRESEMLDANAWIEEYPESDNYFEGSEAFRRSYDPYRSERRRNISPYDDIIKKNAESIGWDWRYLAAVIYQESHFRIDARSKRGALGLMQIIPESADMYDRSCDLLDPEQNIALGTRMLGKISKYFRKVAASGEECVKMTLAAYNAGPGRVFDCIALARQKGISPGYWENLAAVIPAMRDSSILNNPAVKCGVFQGYETIAYVRRVNSLYRRFCKICPEDEKETE